MLRFIYTFIFASVFFFLTARPIDDAIALYDKGDYTGAVHKLNGILKSSPNDILGNYYLGLSYLKLGEREKARNAFLKAEKKGSPLSSQQLASMALQEFKLDEMDRHLEEAERELQRRRKEAPEELIELRSKAVNIRNMLERVEQIAIIDSIVVDKKDFFKHYQISSDAGKLLDVSVLPKKFSPEKNGIAFEPENDKEVFWSSRDAETDQLVIMHSQILDDGTFDTPSPLSENLNDGGDANYFYLMCDGSTFYFANNGDNSIGGYDIFLSRRDSDGEVLQPQNVGLPYNSPYDDYMLVIDEAAGLGWWATDRNQIPDKVTIYVFIPNETRRNYDPSEPNIGDYAFITDIKSTQSTGLDRSKLTKNPALKEIEGEKAETEFTLNLPNGKTYTTLEDFKRGDAKKIMKQYIAREQELQMMQKTLEMDRRAYEAGDQSVADDIISLEMRILSAKEVLKELRNKIISKELNH